LISIVHLIDLAIFTINQFAIRIAKIPPSVRILTVTVGAWHLIKLWLWLLFRLG
jgi:hypothetical protein